MMPCPSCMKDTADGLLCSLCSEALVEGLRQLPQLMRDLQISYTRQSQAGTGNGGRGDSLVPFDGRAAEVRDEVVHSIGTWVHLLDWRDLATRTPACTCRPYQACIGYVDVPLTPSMAAWCGWLSNRIQRIRGHRGALEISRDVAAAVRKINRTIDSRSDRKFCGFCIAEPDGVLCTGQLWAWPGEGYISCPACNESYDVARSRDKLLREAEDQLATATTILTAVPDAFGVTINSNTFNSWVGRGRLLNKGQLEGVAIYRVGDALALARTAATKRRAG